MQWEFIVALVIAIPVILFPAFVDRSLYLPGLIVFSERFVTHEGVPCSVVRQKRKCFYTIESGISRSGVLLRMSVTAAFSRSFTSSGRGLQ